MEEHDEESEWLHEEIEGKRRPNISLLNRRRLSKYEMDEFFAE